MFKLKGRFFLALVVFALSLANVTAPTPAKAAGCAPAHVVQPGQNLFRIGLMYGVSWVVLQQINGIPNPNLIRVGQQICLPGSVVTPPVVTPLPPLPPAPPPVVYNPPSGAFPYIQLSTFYAKPGQTITITGARFPGNSVVDVFIGPVSPYTPAAYAPVAAATTNVAADGTLNYNFLIPASVGGVAMVGQYLSILVKARGSGYYGFNYFVNIP